ncbi:unnamed protein product [Peronospora destructor]|uniref:Chromosome partition protein Smc n=1 Tax=Peronospora destructor TaxID=86335 RepID=A0AAV0TEH8_9STRA|nr:unnamed protein product [Peronospora destructor]
MVSDQDHPTPSTNEPHRSTSSHRGRGLRLVMPTLQVDISNNNSKGFQSSLTTLSTLWERLVESQADLQENHRVLQQAYQAQVARGDRLANELQGLYRSASHFVVFVQRRYDLMRQLYETTVEASAEYQPALADRQDQASEIDHLRTQLRTEESNRQADNAHFLQQIEQLSDQLRGNTSHDLEELRALHRATKVQFRKEQSLLQGRILILTSQLEQTKSALAEANLQPSQKSSELVGAKTTLDNLSARSMS